MTVQLGNIVLDDNLALKGIEDAPDIAVQQLTAFDGTVDILTMPAATSRQLALVATLDGSMLLGNFLLSQITSIKAIIAAGLPVVLIHHRGTFNVYVLSVTEFLLVDKDVNPNADDWCVATINMVEG